MSSVPSIAPSPSAVDVAPDAAEAPFILTLDVGTSSLRTMLYDARGRAVRDVAVHVPHQMRVTADGGVEVDVDPMVDRAVTAIDGLLAAAGPLAAHIGAVAVDTFWHGLLGVSDSGEALTPLYTWADTRASAAATELKGMLDEQAVHARTGCVLHASYPPAKLRWLSQTQPDIFRRTSCWMAFGEYFYLRLFGHIASSISMASATGLFNQHSCAWDEEVLRAVGVTTDHLPQLIDLHEPFHGLREEYARRWPALIDVPWFPAIGDGAANNIGSSCFTANRIAVMVGTSAAMRLVLPAASVHVRPGLWLYRVDRQRLLIGGALSSGGNHVEWMRETMQLPDLATEENQLAAMQPDTHGLTILPYLAGERSTGWAPHARGAFVGMTLSTRPIDLLRAAMEAVTLRFAAVYDLLSREIPAAHGDRAVQVVASGGALLHSPTWMGMLADALGCRVVASSEAEASSRGAALLALEAIGALAHLADAPITLGQGYDPVAAHHAVYQAALERQQRLYQVLIAGGTAW